MNGSLFAELDRFCGQFALALHNAELQVYAILTLLLVLGILLFPATERSRPGLTGPRTEPRWLWRVYCSAT